MFTKILDDLTLANRFADEIFRNITGDTYNGDVSFIATMRALLSSRVGAEEIKESYTSSNHDAAALRNVSAETLVNAVIGTRLRENNLYIHNVRRADASSRDAFFGILDNPENGFVKVIKGFEEITNIRDFIANTMRFRTRFYTSQEKRVTIIFVEQMNVKRWHAIQSFLPRYFGWLFTENPISEDEAALLTSLTKHTSGEYEDLIERMSSKFDMRSMMIENVLGNLEKNSRKFQLDGVDTSIENVRYQIREYIERYNDLARQLDELNVRRTGLLTMINGASEESELVEYFMSNKNLDPIRTEGSSFEFIVRTYLSNWDPEIFESMRDRQDSAMYNGYAVQLAPFRDWEVRRKFLSAIFLDDVLRVKMCAYYRLDLRGSSTSERGYTYPSSCRDRLPNPHLQRYNCLGNHEMLINEYLMNGDAVGAVAQCVASAGSLNLAESMTFTYFFEWMFRSTEKIIELPDGTGATPEEALNWLNERDKADGDE